ncbi:MAG: hypothetical protein HDR25_06980, partial [Lachnospiraceae bacterium]|nr:hypothetical protein [Lachnospiraceae bacterium]
FDDIIGYIENYFTIKAKYKKKGVITNCFYVCYLVNKLGMDVDEAIKFLDKFIETLKDGKKSISVPRMLIQKTTRDAFINKALSIGKE